MTAEREAMGEAKALRSGIGPHRPVLAAMLDAYDAAVAQLRARLDAALALLVEAKERGHSSECSYSTAIGSGPDSDHCSCGIIEFRGRLAAFLSRAAGNGDR